MFIYSLRVLNKGSFTMLKNLLFHGEPVSTVLEGYVQILNNFIQKIKSINIEYNINDK